MVLSDFWEEFIDRIRIHAKCETLVCQRCGKEYASRGKHDPGICKECERETTFIGGPLDGMSWEDFDKM